MENPLGWLDLLRTHSHTSTRKIESQGAMIKGRISGMGTNNRSYMTFA